MLLSEGMEVVELAEGSEDELFWAVLGDEPYANAEYWQWRLDLAQIAPRLFRIDSSKGKDAVKHIPNFAMREITPDGVFVVDGVFELFVLVGAQARGHRTDIRLALYIAEVRLRDSFEAFRLSTRAEHLYGGGATSALRPRYSCPCHAVVVAVSSFCSTRAWNLNSVQA